MRTSGTVDAHAGARACTVQDLPLEGLIDKEAEKQRLTKELEKVTKELAKSENKLSNENFVARAKPEVVEQERTRKGDWEQKRDQLKAMLENL